MRKIYGAILLAIGLVGGILLSRTFRHDVPQGKTIIQIDSVIIRDTEYIREPVFVESRVVDTIQVPIQMRDTVYIALPIEQNYYRGSDYEAWVSGYKPRLDSLHVFHETKVITRNVTTVTKPKSNAIYASSEVILGKCPSVTLMGLYGHQNKIGGQMSFGIGYEVMKGEPMMVFRYNQNIFSWETRR